MRLDVIVLALMLAYIVAVFARASWHYILARRTRGIEATSRSRRELAADLRIEVGSLNSIAFIAPYLGLVGTCVGIMSAFRPIGMEKHAALSMIASTIAAALVTTAAGILVAVPATCSYNYLCTRIDLLESEVSNEPPAQISRYRQVTRKLALTRRLSHLPAFAVIAAPGLAILVAAWTPFLAPREPTSFGIDLASTRCEYDGDDRPIVLRITDAGQLLLNTEHEDLNSLPGRLSEIYSMRVHRTLYLFPDDGVPFQTVADAIDIVRNTPFPSSSLDITIRLITPRAMNARCPEPIATGSSQHLSR